MYAGGLLADVLIEHNASTMGNPCHGIENMRHELQCWASSTCPYFPPVPASSACLCRSQYCRVLWQPRSPKSFVEGLSTFM